MSEQEPLQLLGLLKLGQYLRRHDLSTMAANTLHKHLPHYADRPPISLKGYLAAVVPVQVLYYIMAVLVLLPRTRPYRVALLPVVACLAVKGATAYDYTAGYPTYNHLNYGAGVMMFVITMRCADWATCETPLERIRSSSETTTRRSVFWDAASLLVNMRGLGWTWSKGLRIPRETRPLTSRSAFVLTTLGWLLRDAFVADALHTHIQLLAPSTFGSTAGGTIFDASLPPVARYLRSTYITVLTGVVIYLSMTIEYHLATLIAFAIPGLHTSPADWPPFSEGPWTATSLTEFWTLKWHQTFRRPFVAVAGRPMRALFGRVGGVMGVFVLSGMLHDWSIWPMGHGTNFAELQGFFILAGVGVVVEKAWERNTGRKVGGLAGWVWSMAWLMITGNLLADAWLRTGLAGCALLPEGARPAKALAQMLLSRYR